MWATLALRLPTRANSLLTSTYMQMYPKRMDANDTPRHTAAEVAKMTGKHLQSVQRLAINNGWGTKRAGHRFYSDAEVALIEAAKTRKPRTLRAAPSPAPAVAAAKPTQETTP